jgi:hypothetical protein
METNRFETEKIIPIKGRLSSNAAAKPNTIGKRAEGRKASSSSQLISFLSLSLSLSPPSSKIDENQTERDGCQGKGLGKTYACNPISALR